MPILPIYLLGSEVLRQKAKPVKGVDNSVIALVYDMFDTMRNAGGIGLAANQVGDLRRIVTIDISETDEGKGTKPLVLINPEILNPRGESTLEEGCLSIPDIREEVTRAESITIRFRDVNFHQHELEVHGWLARVVQHETDHLDGVMFIDYLSAAKRRLLKGRLTKIRKGEVETQYPVVSGIEV